MPQVEDIIRIPNIHIKEVQERNQGARLKVCAEFSGPKRCPHCVSRQLRLKGHYFRGLKHTRTGNVLVELSVKVFKFKCKKCDKYFVTSLPRVLPRRRATENFRLEVYEDHFAGHTGLHLARVRKLSTSTVERWFKDFIKRRYQETLSRRKQCPRVLGIDEHFFTRKKGYATTFVDLAGRYVFDVRLGRSREALKGYLRGLQGRERVRVVAMDLSSTYRSIVKEFFPNAMIVADRFHVVRLVQHQFQKVWKNLDEVGRKNRGLISLFRRKRSKLKPEQQEKLSQYLESVPGLKVVDDFQQRLLGYLRMKGIGPAMAKKHILGFLNMIEQLKDSGFSELQTLSATLTNWLDPIARMWRFSRNNSITEGFHTKMEMISRRAYGFRNFQNYRLRVLALCGWDGISRRH